MERDHATAFAILSCAAHIYEKMSQYDDAIQVYAQLIECLQEKSDDDDTQENERRKIHAFSHMTYIHLTLKDYVSCLNTLYRLLKHQQALLKPNHSDIERTKLSITKLEKIVKSQQNDRGRQWR